MDKVQFNNEVVSMRKVVKRVKVLITHSLTRHITKLRKKKGSEQQILKNKRRVERFVAEIEAMKDLQPDTITKKAATMKKTLQEVLNNPKSSAQDRVLARIIYHKLIQERVTQFKDMVTKDFLRTGSKKYKRLRKGKFESEAQARLKEEEDYQVTLERMVSADKMDNVDDDDDDKFSQKFAKKMRTFATIDHQDDDGNDDDKDDDDDNDGDEVSQKFLKKMRTLDKKDQDDDGDDGDDDFDDDAHSLEKLMIKKMMDRDEDNSDDDDLLGSKVRGAQHSPHKHKVQLELLVGEKRIIKDEDAHRISEDAALPEKSHLIGKRKLDSTFLGSLSSMQDEDITEMLQTTEKESMKQRNKAKPPQKQQPKARPAQEKTQGPAKKMRHKIPMVDQPNPVRHTPGEKLIPGINCHPDLPPRHALGDTQEKKTGKKPFPTRPQSKQLPAKPLASQSRHAAKQHPTQGKHPASATISSQKKPAAKESLHPSWEASRKRKEESKIVPFQGKKITFDED
ncbi:serum response factor-binding protein 1-like [Patiria miniata]|uniref:Serum response factor-binding protein 1 n=1 Tax=Patiria miniata TaxID=46514 RepID=A0A914BC35_PATMI|nr:serum response factor-binding protein 1-like [Patiria miniata]